MNAKKKAAAPARTETATNGLQHRNSNALTARPQAYSREFLAELRERLPQYIPNDAHDIWAVAQTHLNRILPNDISREEVLREVIEYCETRISANK